MSIKILFPAEMIARRTKEIGQEITQFYKNKPLTVIVLMNGAMIFGADLFRSIDSHDLFLDTLMVSSYVDDVRTDCIFHSKLKLPVAGRHVLIVDDILDSGCTLHCVRHHLESLGALSIRSCVLLDKVLPPGQEKKMKADWAGFPVSDLFVVGCGLDSREKYRNLPDICYIGKNDGAEA